MQEECAAYFSLTQGKSANIEFVVLFSHIVRNP